MGLLDWIRGRPHDTQADRAAAAAGSGADETGSTPDNIAAATNAGEVETAIDTTRDGEAMRHQGI